MCSSRAKILTGFISTSIIFIYAFSCACYLSIRWNLSCGIENTWHGRGINWTTLLNINASILTIRCALRVSKLAFFMSKKLYFLAIVKFLTSLRGCIIWCKL
jgi:hypothetical protein